MKCTQCGRRPTDLPSPKTRAAWNDDDPLCPPCLRNWHRPTTNQQSPRCAGCGKRTTALTGDRCQRCAERGVELIPLFDQEPST